MRKVRTTELLLRGHKNATVLGTDKDGNVVSKTTEDLGVFSKNPKNAPILATDKYGRIIKGEFPSGGGSGDLGGSATDNKANIILGREYKEDVIVESSTLQNHVSSNDWAHISEFKYTLIAKLDKAVEGEDIKVCVRVLAHVGRNYPKILLHTEAFGKIKADGSPSYIGLSSHYYDEPIPKNAYGWQTDMLVKITSPDSRLKLQSYEFLSQDAGHNHPFIPLSAAVEW